MAEEPLPHDRLRPALQKALVDECLVAGVGMAATSPELGRAELIANVVRELYQYVKDYGREEELAGLAPLVDEATRYVDDLRQQMLLPDRRSV